MEGEAEGVNPSQTMATGLNTENRVVCHSTRTGINQLISTYWTWVSLPSSRSRSAEWMHPPPTFSRPQLYPQTSTSSKYCPSSHVPYFRSIQAALSQNGRTQKHSWGLPHTQLQLCSVSLLWRKKKQSLKNLRRCEENTSFSIQGRQRGKKEESLDRCVSRHRGAFL